MSERSLGGHQVAVPIPDDLSPTRPAPSEGRQGPPISEPLKGSYLELHRKLDELGSSLALQTRPDLVATGFQGQLDSSGNGVIGVYQVAEGYEARLQRLVGNALVVATGVPYTPAAPYSNAAAYLELYQSPQAPPQGVVRPGVSGLLDFGPPVAGGPIFPFLITDNSTQSSLVRGPNWLVLYVNTGPASAMVVGRCQIQLARQKGIV